MLMAVQEEWCDAKAVKGVRQESRWRSCFPLPEYFFGCIQARCSKRLCRSLNHRMVMSIPLKQVGSCHLLACSDGGSLEGLRSKIPFLKDDQAREIDLVCRHCSFGFLWFPLVSPFSFLLVFLLKGAKLLPLWGLWNLDRIRASWFKP